MGAETSGNKEPAFSLPPAAQGPGLVAGPAHSLPAETADGRPPAVGRAHRDEEDVRLHCHRGLVVDVCLLCQRLLIALDIAVICGAG